MAKPDMLKTLSPELRLKIYQEVLTTNARLRRPNVDEEQNSFAALLVCSKYIYKEAVDILYSNNTFKLTFAEVKGFENATDFCKIKTVYIKRTRDYDENGEGGIRTLAQNLIAEAKNQAARTSERKPALQSVTIEEDSLSPEYVQDMRDDTIGGRVVDADLGVWDIRLGQPYKVLLQHLPLRRIWARVKSETPLLLRSFGSHSILQWLELNWCKGITSEDKLETLVCGLALDVTRGEEFHTVWYNCIPLYHVQGRGLLSALSQILLSAPVSEGPRRLRDVDLASGRVFVEWANNFLLSAFNGT